MEKVIFDFVSFKRRLNDLRDYLAGKGYSGYQYDVGYYDAIKHVINMLNDYE